MMNRVLILAVGFCLICNPAEAQSEATARPVRLQAVGSSVRVQAATPAENPTQKKLTAAIGALEKAEAAIKSAQETLESVKGNELIRIQARQAEYLKTRAKILQTQLKQSLNRQPTVTVVPRGAISSASGVRKTDDIDDPTERFLLLTPAGPIVIAVKTTVDGKPFRAAREELISEMLEAADRDDDGKTTWSEAFATPAFTLGRVRIANDQIKQRYLQMYDLNGDKLTDRYETRAFLARLFGGQAFTLSGGGSPYGRTVLAVNGRRQTGAGQVNLMRLLDGDNDGVLSEKELETAGERLKSMDANDDDLLYANELTGQSRPTARPNQARSSVPSRTAVLLGPTASAAQVFATIQQRYQTASGKVPGSSFGISQELFKELDENQDGQLVAEEVLRLNDVEPAVSLSLALSKRQNAAGLVVESTNGVQPTLETKERTTFDFPGLKLAIVANLNPPRQINYQQMAQRYLTQYDKDKNEYIDKDEIPNARQFGLWDLDGDGKVFKKEINDSYSRMQAPQSTQVRAIVRSPGDPLFFALDQSGDGRLGLREMQTVAKRLLKFDADGNHQVSGSEVPGQLEVAFAMGNAIYSTRGSGARQNPPNVSPARGPAWFTGMDRNGDGDVTLKEFLGTKAEFAELDQNKDGFIEPQEAEAASADESGESSEAR